MASSKKTSGSKKVTATKAATPIAILGTLTDEGVECQALRQDKTKKLFTLLPKSKLKGFKNGDHVGVIGTIQPNSFCGQGTTIAVLLIAKI